MTEVVKTVAKVAQEKGAIRVLKVRLEVGELTFLGPDQMEFAFEILKEDREVVSGAELELGTIEARGTCSSCGYMGRPKVHEEPEFHFVIPTLQCPACGERLEITEGRDLYIRDIELEVPDEEASGVEPGPLQGDFDGRGGADG
jgi:hydrogenase nickel incorporation protein HypA/HybF